MLKEMTMTEVLAKISLAKKKMESAGKAASTTRGNIFMTVKKKNRDVTIANVNVEESKNGITANFDSTMDNFTNLYKLLMIKEAVNSNTRIEIPNPDFRKGGTINATITEILALYGEDSISRKYYKKILDKMKSDYAQCEKIISDNEVTVLSETRITEYVTQRLAALKENPTKAAVEANYEKYSKEYIDANSMEYVDPIDLADKIEKLENWMDEFYNNINFKLSEVNSKTKVWVDLDKDDNFWGYVSNKLSF